MNLEIKIKKTEMSIATEILKTLDFQVWEGPKVLKSLASRISEGGGTKAPQPPSYSGAD